VAAELGPMADGHVQEVGHFGIGQVKTAVPLDQPDRIADVRACERAIHDEPPFAAVRALDPCFECLIFARLAHCADDGPDARLQGDEIAIVQRHGGWMLGALHLATRPREGGGQIVGQPYGGFKESGLGRENSLEGMLEGFMRRGLDPRQLGLNVDRMRDELRQRALLEVKGYLLLEAIAAKENIEVSEPDLDAHYEKLSAELKQPVEKIRQAFRRQDTIEGVRGRLRQDKALAFLLSKANLS